MNEESMDIVQQFTPPQDDTFKLLSGHKESVFCVDFDSTGKFLVSGGQDHIAIIWNVVTGQTEFTCRGHEDSVHCVSFSPDGSYLCTGDMAGSIRVWLRPMETENPIEWRLLTTLNVGDLLWIQWWSPPLKGTKITSGLPNPAVLLAGDDDGLVTVWPVRPTLANNTANHAKCLSGTGHAALDGLILPSSLNTDKPKLVVLYRNGDLRLWDLKTEQVLDSIQLFSSHSSLSNLCRSLEVFQLISPQSFIIQSKCTNLTPIVGVDQHDLLLITGNGFICPVSVKYDTEMLNSRLKILDVLKMDDDGSIEALSCSWTHPLFAFGSITGVLGICDTQTISIRQKWTYIDEDDGQPIGITSLLWSRYQPVFFTATVKASIVAWSGVTGTIERTSTGSVKDPSPLKIWWGHKAMILDLTLLSFHRVTSETAIDDGNKTSEALKKTELYIEPFLCTASDDTTVRLFKIDIP
ncbi:unnamed protein product [Heterobilharzia americana]|nr:unnamed protein product [Heterobilharzia americana]